MKILIFDPNPESAQRDCQALNEVGHESKYVCSKSQCFKELAADPCDLLLADCGIPDCSIPSLIQELKQKGFSLPIVVSTQPGDERAALDAIHHGASDYIIRDPDGHYLILLSVVVEEAHQREVVIKENIRYRDELAMAEMSNLSPSFLMNLRYKDELTRLNQKLAESIIHDSLTGLYNRRKMEMDVAAELERIKRYHYPLACLMLAIERLKELNEAHGHLAGDLILRGLGQMLLESRRLTDSCYRYSGDEFLVLMPHTSLTGAEIFADRLLDCIRHHTFEIDNHSLQITVSMGLAAYQRGVVDTPDQLLKCAAAALNVKRKT